MKILQDFGKYDLIIMNFAFIMTIAIFAYGKVQYDNFLEIREFIQKIEHLKEMK